MKQFVLAFAAWASLCFAIGAGCDDAPGVDSNAPEQQHKPFVVVVSIDGMRWDFPDRYPMPNLQILAADGTRAERLLPVWPTLTFPNHYSLVTGLSPSAHGLVGNEFPLPDKRGWYRVRDRDSVSDGRFYLGEPIWVTAQRQGMLTAAYFWVGSEAPVMGVRPSHWRSYDKQVPGEARVDQVLEWLALPAAQRPHLVLLYFEGVDDQAHWNGIGSDAFLDAVRQVDGHIGRLRAGIAALPHGDRVNLVVVTDHGQMPYLDEPPFILDEAVDLDGLSLVEGGPYVMAWQDRPDPEQASLLAERVNGLWRHGRAYTRESAPRAWRLEDSPRQPDLVFLADAGHAVLSHAEMRRKINRGDHGWAPEVPEMQGVFMAAGPGIRRGGRIGAVPITDVHALLLALLELDSPLKPAEADNKALQFLGQP